MHNFGKCLPILYLGRAVILSQIRPRKIPGAVLGQYSILDYTKPRYNLFDCITGLQIRVGIGK